MLVEVRVKLETAFRLLWTRSRVGSPRHSRCLMGSPREELAVHHAGIHVSNKDRRTVWLRYRVMPEGDAADSAKVPQRILWVK